MVHAAVQRRAVVDAGNGKCQGGIRKHLCLCILGGFAGEVMLLRVVKRRGQPGSAKLSLVWSSTFFQAVEATRAGDVPRAA